MDEGNVVRIIVEDTIQFAIRVAAVWQNVQYIHRKLEKADVNPIRKLLQAENFS